MINAVHLRHGVKSQGNRLAANDLHARIIHNISLSSILRVCKISPLTNKSALYREFSFQQLLTFKCVLNAYALHAHLMHECVK